MKKAIKANLNNDNYFNLRHLLKIDYLIKKINIYHLFYFLINLKNYIY